MVFSDGDSWTRSTPTSPDLDFVRPASRFRYCNSESATSVSLSKDQSVIWSRNRRRSARLDEFTNLGSHFLDGSLRLVGRYHESVDQAERWGDILGSRPSNQDRHNPDPVVPSLGKLPHNPIA